MTENLSPLLRSLPFVAIVQADGFNPFADERPRALDTAHRPDRLLETLFDPVQEPSERPVPRPGILTVEPYRASKSAVRTGESFIDLSANESALGPSPKVLAAYRERAADIHLYPDGMQTGLRRAIGTAYHLDPDRIVCGNGSEELLILLARGFAGPGDEVIYSRHGFVIHPIAAKTAGATAVAASETGDLTASVDSLLDQVTARTRIVYLDNPKNPTGTLLPLSEIHRLQAGLPPHVLLVIDAAYADYVEDPAYSSGFELVDRFENVVVTRTFSKFYGMGGLRLGWAYAPAAIADILNRLRAPFNISSVALAAGEAALSDSETIRAVRRHNHVWRGWLSERLIALGLTVIPSHANFLLVRFSTEEKARRVESLLREHGILVRNVAGYGLPDCLRITIGRAEGVCAVADTLGLYLGSF